MRRFAALLAVLVVASTSCAGDGATTTTAAATQQPSTTTEPSTTPAPLPVPDAPTIPRIATATVDGTPAFINSSTGKRFRPIGTNYVENVPTGQGWFGNWPLATDVFDRDRMAAVMRDLAGRGYNAMRIFFDFCEFGPTCLNGDEPNTLNSDYLDNIVALTELAAEHRVYLVMVSHDLPESYREAAARGESPQIVGHRNIHALSAIGLDVMARYWDDLLGELAERGAVFEAVLGWQVQNEWSLHSTLPPISLDEGFVEVANGRTYDLATEKRQMLIDSNLHYIERIGGIVERHDPEALVTMGFFAPMFPNETTIGNDPPDVWYVDTQPLLGAAALDFFDFHLYPTDDLSMEEFSENFGYLDGLDDVPMIMGEFGLDQTAESDPQVTALVLQRWVAESCDHGFDGWFHWEYLGDASPQFDYVGGAENGALILDALAPGRRPDPCAPPDVEIDNLAFERPVTASSTDPTMPEANATDGTDAPWWSGVEAPGWIRIELDGPQRVGSVELLVDQFPSGPTEHRVTVELADGNRVESGRVAGDTEFGDVLIVRFEPIDDVVAVRVDTVSSPSFVSWGEIVVRAT